jgi:5'-nucleotidase
MTIRPLFACLLLPLIAACSAQGGVRSTAPAQPVTVRILGINDFHGAIEPPKQGINHITPSGERIRVPVGGAAYLASAIDILRQGHPYSLTVSAGDLIGGTPIVSSLFLDEPAIGVMNRIGLDFNAVGNHEFDRGRAELLRMQNGGCEKNTVREPCAVERPFEGAKFRFLAANVMTEQGKTLFPASAMRRFGSGKAAVDVGLIGLTLKNTPSLASPSGLVGLTFTDEAEAINREVAALKRKGAEAIVVMIHEGLYTTVGYNDKSCGGISGDLPKVLARLDPRVDLVVSGHTHWAYVCDYAKVDPARPFLVTSAGLWGQFVTAIDLTIDPASGKVVNRAADNHVVQSESYVSPAGPVPLSDTLPRYAPRPDIAAYVARYSAAVKSAASRVVGNISGGPAFKPALATHESALGNLIADIQLAATRASERGGAEIALMNNTGIRADLVPAPDGAITFGQIYAVQPFANTLITKSFTGKQLKALLEQQFDGQSFDQAFSPSSGFTFAFDLTRPLGSRVFDVTLNGAPIEEARVYRVTMNSFLAGGGDSFTLFREGSDVLSGAVDLEATEEWLRAAPGRAFPALGRVRNLTPAAK